MDAADRHYVRIARLATIGIALAGGIISLAADSIQQLLEVYYTVALAINVLVIMRWFWWRQNATGELAGIATVWGLAFLLLFTKLFDSPIRELFDLRSNAQFSSDYEFLGARILFVTVPAIVVGVTGSLLTPATDLHRMQEFVQRVRPFQFGWKPVIATLRGTYQQGESPLDVLRRWLVVSLCSFSLLFGIGQVLLGSMLIGLLLFVVFFLTLWWAIVDINAQSVLKTPVARESNEQ